MTMLGGGERAADKARKAEEAARRAEELAEQARKAAEEAKAALREAEEEQKSPEAAEGPEEAVRAADGAKDHPADEARSTDATEAKVTDAESTDAGPTDAGPTDAKVTDAGTADAGTEGAGAGGGRAAEDDADGAGTKAPAAEKTDDETAVDEADEDDEDDADDEPVAKRRRVVVRAGLGSSGVVLLLLSVALGGALGWLWYKDRQMSGVEEAREQVAFAAAQAAQDLSSYDYRTVDSDLRRAAQHTTGKFHDDFVKQAERVSETARKQQTVTEGVALKTGIEQVSGSKATALVFLNQETAKTGTTERLPNQYTLRLTMKKVGGRWLVEKLQVV